MLRYLMSSILRWAGCFFCLLLPLTMVAKDYTVSGYITDSVSGETLINAAVYDRVSGKGTVTNLYGFYSLTLPAGKVALLYSYIGYRPAEKSFELKENTLLTVRMQPSLTLEEVVVTGRENREIGVKGSQMSTVEIPVSQIKALPTLFGETDVLKALQLLPGVQGGMEGTAGMYVRGGGPDENLVLLDGVPVYNVNHAGGFFSVFNADAIKNVTLYKGGFPARFGGRLSSVVDVRMKDGDDKKIHGNFSLGLISSKLNLEGPIIKEKTTFNISLRRTYSDLVMKPLMWYMKKDYNFDKLSAGYYFYDLNVKLTHKFSEKDRLYLSYYSGDDAIYTKMRVSEYSTDNSKYAQHINMDMNWGNLVTALRWNHVINSKLFANTTASYTRYRFDIGLGTDEMYQGEKNYSMDISMKYKTAIEDYTIKTDFDYMPHANHAVKFGANYTYHTFKPGVSVFSMKTTSAISSTGIDTTYGDANIYSQEAMLYVEDNMNIGSYLRLNVGLHYSAYLTQQQFYHSLQPRLGIRVLMGERLSFKAGYAKMNQYIHLLSNSNISLPTDLWVPVTKQIEPMLAHQYSAGFFYNLMDKIDLSVEAYYKSMDNLIEYKDGASFLGTTAGWEEKVCVGRGWAYGVEFLAQKSYGKTTGWIAYTWSKSERLFDRPGQELSQGQPFPAKYDRRHDISITASHKFNDRIDVSGTWVYSTGNCATMSLQQYAKMTDGVSSVYYGTSIGYIATRNNYRYNDYHRMDLGINFHKQKKRGIRTWNISIYNVYNQKNPFMVYPSTEYDYDATGSLKSRKTLKQVSVFTLLPSISYSFKF